MQCCDSLCRRCGRLISYRSEIRILQRTLRLGLNREQWLEDGWSIVYFLCVHNLMQDSPCATTEFNRSLE